MVEAEENLRNSGHHPDKMLEVSLEGEDPLVADGVHIQCINSSEFVVGKQTSFNGPVTIINYSGTGPGPEISPDREKVIIKDQVLSKTAATILQETANDTAKGNEHKNSKESFCEKLYHWLHTKRNIHIFLFAVLVTAFVIMAIVFARLNINSQNKKIHQFLLTNSTNSSKFIYTKEDWGGEPATSVVQLQLPVPYVIITHSVTQQCFDLETCRTIISNIQTYHLSNEWYDISYNFLVDSSGNIYEGRGWAARSEVEGRIHLKSITVNFIGDYSRDVKPTAQQLEGVQHLIEYGIKDKKISENYSLVAANATYATLSPGKQVYEEIKKWPHFNSKVPASELI